MTPRGWSDANEVADLPYYDYVLPGMVVQIDPPYDHGFGRPGLLHGCPPGVLAIVERKDEAHMHLLIPAIEAGQPPHRLAIPWEDEQHVHLCLNGHATLMWDAREEEL